MNQTEVLLRCSLIMVGILSRCSLTKRRYFKTEVPTGSVVSVCHCQETGFVVSATVFLGYLKVPKLFFNLSH
jgi:hypothetical protein